ncbi:MAG: HupE/UreJ family protein [Acidobacteria bacterium]|nr:HupE/UreJ family protein [Acidobacteriota bacterium]
MRTVLYIFAECLFILFAFAIVQAHDPGLSAAEVKLDGNLLKVRVSYARADIESLVKLDLEGNGDVSQSEFDTSRVQLETLAADGIEIRFENEPAGSEAVSAAIDDSGAIHFDLSFARAGHEQFTFRDLMIGRLAQGHKQYFSVISADGRRIEEKLLDAKIDAVAVDLSSVEPERPQTFLQFILLGVEHILTGFDHLAFLLALLLFGGSFREAAKIITSFTFAHLISLALATFNLIQLPSGIVEPLIAASIIYVGLENIFRREIKWRWLLTFAFGLIHGLGFAAVLRDLGFGSDIGQTVVPLLSFNLGVELGQVGIAALVLPLIWKLKQRPSFTPVYVPVCSTLLVLLGGYWLIERTFI